MFRLLFSLFALSFSSALISQDISAGLIAHYAFSGDANDLSGNDNHGSNFGALLTEDRFGNPNSAYLFNGTDSYISIPSSASLESPATALTMSSWIKPAGFSFVGDSFGPILMKSDSPNNEFMYRMDIYESGLAAALNNWNNSAVLEADIPFNEWHHLAISFCPTSVKFYVNNILVGEENFDCNITVSNLPLEIGRDVPGLLEVFNGAIDDIRIYDRCLSDIEINLLFEENTTSVASYQLNSFSISPNPSSAEITVQTKEQNLFHQIQIVDLLGQVVFNHQFNSTDSKRLDLRGLKKGLYSLIIMDKNSRATSLLMVN